MPENGLYKPGALEDLCSNLSHILAEDRLKELTSNGHSSRKALDILIEEIEKREIFRNPGWQILATLETLGEVYRDVVLQRN